MAGRTGFNPFYLLLVVAGIVFAITACAYGAMTFVELRGSTMAGGRSALVEFMEAHGAVLLAAELAVLAAATAGAISTDRLWQRRAEKHDRPHSSGPAD
ncbi:MAG TPA: hypothetical protein VHY20_13240 [Pirellulales bacterium]|nr:hypothetical protein [Pirellulales bacterium]